MADAELTPKPRNADLPVRFASGAVMIAIAGIAMWLGVWVFDAFVVLVAAYTFYEFAGLVRRFARSGGSALAWLVFGALYIGLAACVLILVESKIVLLVIIAVVVLVDSFAYAFGRTIGGPKIAPRISPSKTWAGLFGGIVGATLALIGYYAFGAAHHGVASYPVSEYVMLVLPGILLAVVAQSGDFFESWMKRRAGVKDSSNLIPGHGGVFDRTDGLIPVTLAFGAAMLILAPHQLSL